MSEPVIPSTPPVVNAHSVPVNTIKASFILLPESNIQLKQITGEVISIKDNQVTLKTQQGIAVFEAENIQLMIGQKITLKLNQNDYIQKTLPLLFQMIIAKDKKEQTITQTLPDLSILSTIQNSYDSSKPISKDIQANFFLLPKILSPSANTILVNQLFNLPITNTIPPVISQGILNLQTLITQAYNTDIYSNNNFINSTNSQEPQLLYQLMSILKSTIDQNINQITINSQNLNVLLQPGSDINKVDVQQLIQQFKSMTSSELSSLQSMWSSQNIAVDKSTVLMTVLALNNSFDIQNTTTMNNINQGKSDTKLTNLIALAFTPEGQQLLVNLKMPSEIAKQYLPGSIIISEIEKNNLINLNSIQISSDKSFLQTVSNTRQPLHPAIGENWDNLNDLINEIKLQSLTAQIDLSPIMKQIIPTTQTQQFTPAVLFFMALIKYNFDGNNWLVSSPKLEGLLSKKIGLMDNLLNDIQVLKKIWSDDTVTDTWRPLPLPLQVNDNIMRIQCFIRHQLDSNSDNEKEQHDKNKKKKTRFLMNVPQTNLGNIQIDGLVQIKQLDVILRSESDLDVHQRVAIGQRFQSALEINGLMGELSFQSGKQNYIRV